MNHGQADERAQLNWMAILSFTGSLAVSLAVWAGVIRALMLLVK